MLVIADVFMNTYLPVVLGALLGALGSFVFVSRAKALSTKTGDRPSASLAERRKLALRIIVCVYALIAFVCMVVAIAVGDLAFIALSGAILLIACGGLLIVWSSRWSRHFDT